MLLWQTVWCKSGLFAHLTAFPINLNVHSCTLTFTTNYPRSCFRASSGPEFRGPSPGATRYLELALFRQGLELALFGRGRECRPVGVPLSPKVGLEPDLPRWRGTEGWFAVGVVGEALGEIGVAHVRPPEADHIRIPTLQPRLCQVAGVTSIPHQFSDPGTCSLVQCVAGHPQRELLRELVETTVFKPVDNTNVPHPPLPELLDGFREGLDIVRATHLPEAPVWGEPHTHPTTRVYSEQRVDHLTEQTQTIIDRTPVLVGPLVSLCLNELVDQVPVRSVQLHHVEPGRLRVGGRLAVVLNDLPDLPHLQRPRSLVRLLLPVHCGCQTGWLHIGCRDGLVSVHIRVSLPTQMPQLHRELRPPLLHPRHDRFPHCDLLLIPYPRRAVPSKAPLRNSRRLRNH
eukprot:Hpha_TRINITY_DN12282_c0_g1::TRINITY_DN12282_c0_g1_i1::g.16669::m.16669